jgi:hypothetical protein
LHDLQLHITLLQHAILVDGEADGEGDVVVVGDFMVLDLAAICATAVLGGRRVGEVPFYE